LVAPAKEGDVAEVEVDLGTTKDFLTALPNEPPEITIIRYERENELLAQLNSASLALQREQAQRQLIEEQVREVTVNSEEFMETLTSSLTDKLFTRFINRLQGWGDE